MDASTEKSPHYPLLQQLSRQRNLAILPIYRIADLAALLDVSRRTVSDWISRERLVARDLPGHGRLLPQDIEDFLKSSVKKRDPSASEPGVGTSRRRRYASAKASHNGR